jgi:hypothetical protein
MKCEQVEDNETWKQLMKQREEHGARSVSVHRCDLCVGAWAAHETGVQLSGQGNVTGKAALALDQISQFVVVAGLGIGKFEF